MSLFRKEVIEEKDKSRFGKVVISIPRSFTAYTITLFLISSSFLVILALSDYSRKERVTGVLVPSLGQAKITSLRAGEIKKLWVKEGQMVVESSPMLETQSVTYLANGNDLNSSNIRSIKNQLVSVQNQIQLKNTAFVSKINQLDISIHEIQTQIRQIRQLIKLEKQLLQIDKEQYEQAQKLFNSGHLTNIEMASRKQAYLSQLKQLQEKQQQLNTKENQLIKEKLERQVQPNLLEQNIASLNRDREDLQMRLGRVESEFKVITKAPIGGKVAGLQIHEGELVKPGQLLMTIIPKGSELIAELHVPSKASGFLRRGQRVKIRYEAFSYQRYGLFNGKIEEITRTALLPNEIDGPLNKTEALFKVKVSLDNQNVGAFGEQHELQPGMKLEADIELDNMSLLDWIMMPIHAVKGRLN